MANLLPQAAPVAHPAPMPPWIELGWGYNGNHPGSLVDGDGCNSDGEDWCISVDAERNDSDPPVPKCGS